MELRIRSAMAEDEPALYEICHLTGDSGEDATGRVMDRRFLGDLYAVPYLRFDPGLAWVAEDDEGVGGYLVGTADTEAFQTWARQAWWPQVWARCAGTQARSALEADCLTHLQESLEPAPLSPCLKGYPAHLHVNLLPRLRGQGAGRRLMETFLEALRLRGVPGAHWGVWRENAAAMAFYHRLGADVLGAEPWGVLFGYRLV